MPLITQPLIAVSPTSIAALPMVENTAEADSEGGYDYVGYYLLGAPAEVEVPDRLNVEVVDEITIPEDTYLHQVIGCMAMIDTASDADQLLLSLIRPLQRGHTMQSILETHPETTRKLTSSFHLKEVLALSTNFGSTLTKVEVVVHKVRVMAILDTGSPVNVISSQLIKKIKLVPDLDYIKEFGTAGPNNTRALSAYSSLPIHVGKLILSAPAVA
ncbi:hypothetical protein L0F63_007512 [Massospora cicadina]|nr:hypothetical protein L0F63_007512 [Massospora cicadina]